MRIHSSPVVGVGSKRPLSRMAPACRGGNVSACAKFPEHAHFFHTVVLLIVIVGNSIRLASEVESDRARQRRVREACDLAPRAAQRFVAGDHCAWREKSAAVPGPISRAIQPDLALAGWWASPYLCRKGAIPRERDWTRGQQRGCSPPPKLADTWWSGLGVWRATRSRGALTTMPGSSADAESGPRAEIMERSGHGDRTHYIRHHHD